MSADSGRAPNLTRVHKMRDFLQRISPDPVAVDRVEPSPVEGTPCLALEDRRIDVQVFINGSEMDQDTISLALRGEKNPGRKTFQICHMDEEETNAGMDWEAKNTFDGKYNAVIEDTVDLDGRRSNSPPYWRRPFP